MASPMPNPNATISTTVRLDPPLDRAPGELLEREGGISVELEGRRARLDPADERSAGFAQILDGLGKLGMPVYVEVDPATDAVTRVLVPTVSPVVSVRPGEEGVLDVELEASHARHRLRLSGPDADELERAAAGRRSTPGGP